MHNITQERLRKSMTYWQQELLTSKDQKRQAECVIQADRAHKALVNYVSNVLNA